MEKTIKKWIVTMALCLSAAALIAPGKAEAASKKVSVKKQAEAVRAYKKYVTAKKYKKYTKTTKSIAFLLDVTTEELYNCLPDLNHDGIPELVLNKSDNSFYVFTYRNKQVKYVKKIKFNKNADPSILYHLKKNQFYSMELDFGALMKAIENISADAESGDADESALIKQLLDSLSVKIRECTYKVSANGLKIRKVKKQELAVKNTSSGIRFSMNGTERFRCVIYVNGKMLNELLAGDTDKLKFDSMRIEFRAPGSADILAIDADLGGITAEELLEADDLGDLKFKEEYSYGGKKISEKEADKKFTQLTSFINSFRTLAGGGQVGALMAESLSPEEIRTYLSPRPESMRLNCSWGKLRKGQTLKLRVKSVRPSDAGAGLIFSSSNEKVAKVTESGKVKALKPGKAVVTAVSKSNPKLSRKVKVTVRK